MKKTNLILLSLLLATVSFLNGCNTVGSIATKPITQQYPERWEKTYVGMPLDEFKQVWPESKGPFTDVNNNVTFTWTPPIIPYTQIRIMYFTFKDNNLVSFTEMGM